MDAKLFILWQMQQYKEKFPVGTLRVEVNSCEILFHGDVRFVESRFGSYETTEIESFEFDNERIAPDVYEFEYQDSFSIEEMLEAQATYEADLATYKLQQQDALVKLELLAKDITQKVNEGLALAEQFGVPFNVRVGKYTNDLRKIDAVDWDSSSMYC
ncbi:hypothetical protein D3C80_435230 [compost metagenome]